MHPSPRPHLPLLPSLRYPHRPAPHCSHSPPLAPAHRPDRVPPPPDPSRLRSAPSPSPPAATRPAARSASFDPVFGPHPPLFRRFSGAFPASRSPFFRRRYLVIPIFLYIYSRLKRHSRSPKPRTASARTASHGSETEGSDTHGSLHPRTGARRRGSNRKQP